MSALDNISSVDMLECLITKDPRWCWILEEGGENQDFEADSTNMDGVPDGRAPGPGGRQRL